MPGGFEAQVGLGPAAYSGLPAGAGSLPRSLPCEAPAPCVFRILGNGQGAPARAPNPLTPRPRRAGSSGHTTPTSESLASAKAGFREHQANLVYLSTFFGCCIFVK